MTNHNNLVCMELRHLEKIIMLQLQRLVQTRQEQFKRQKEKVLEIPMVDKLWHKYLQSMLNVPVQFLTNLGKVQINLVMQQLQQQQIQVIWIQLLIQPIKETWVARPAHNTIKVPNKVLQDNLVVYTVLAKRIT